MKKTFFLFLFSLCLLAFTTKAQVQNLVPNPSFEYHTCCPNIGQISCQSPWFCSILFGDEYDKYYHTCAPQGGGGGVPLSIAGFQYPRTGDAYTLIRCYAWSVAPPNAREYMETPLVKPLQKGKRYCVRFFVNLANDAYAISDMGAYFSDTAITNDNNYPFSFQPQVNNPVTNYLNDTLKWMPVSGSFTAKGGEKYITLGTFVYNNAQLHFEDIRDTLNGGGAIYYIDDVSVIELPDSAAGLGGSICKGDSVQLGKAVLQGFTYNWYPTTGLSNNTSAQPWAKPAQTTTYYLSVQDSAGCSSTDTVTVTVCPPPTLQIPNVITPNNDGKNDYFVIENLPDNSELTIYNRWGNNVYQSLNYQNNWKADEVNAGTYYYLLTLPNKEVKKGFLEVIK
ncbi:MAG: gliding motility-associated C-terminal domain-containing protein [Bacteroidia bacterium]